MFFNRIMVSAIILSLMTSQVDGQILLQLEIPHQVEAIKFYNGDEITFKTTDRPSEWQKRTIEYIIHGDNVIVFEDGMVALKEITHFRIYNNTAKAVGHVFTGFGSGWLLFGSIASLAGKYAFTTGTFAIGVVGLGVGWLLRKIVSKRSFKIGKNGNLRIIDISFPSGTAHVDLPLLNYHHMVG